MPSIVCRADTRASLDVNEDDQFYCDSNLNTNQSASATATEDPFLTPRHNHNQAQETDAVVGASGAAATAAGVPRKRGRQPNAGRSFECDSLEQDSKKHRPLSSKDDDDGTHCLSSDQLLLNYIANHNHKNPYARNYFGGFVSTPKTAQQHCAQDCILDVLAGDFIHLKNDEGGNVFFPNDDPEHRRPVEPSNKRLYQLYLGTIAQQPSGEVDWKVGQMKVDSITKQGLYDEKYGDGNTSLDCILSYDGQTYEAQHRMIMRSRATNVKLCGIAPGNIHKYTVRQALTRFDRDGHPWELDAVRYSLENPTCIHFGGARFVPGVAIGVLHSDMESACTQVMEKQGLIKPNLPQHPHEHLQGDMSFPLSAETTIEEALRDLFLENDNFTEEELKRVANRRHQPTHTSTWAPDLLRPEFGLTVILMDIILLQQNTRNKPAKDGRLIWIDAFGEEHPVTREEAKQSQGRLCIYSDSEFSNDSCERAFQRIESRLKHLEDHGGWEYMERNKLAMAVIGKTMEDYILSRHEGTDHPRWEEVESKTVAFGVSVFRMKKDDCDKFRFIFVRGAPSYQGCSAPDLDLNLALKGMSECAISNQFFRRLSEILLTPCESLVIKDLESIFDEPVMGNCLFGFNLYAYLVKNLHLSLRSASRLAKAFMNTSANMLALENYPIGTGARMCGTSTMFTQSFRQRDEYAALKAASLVPAAQRNTPQKKLAEKHERNLQSNRNSHARLKPSKRIKKLKLKALEALRYYGHYNGDMNEMKLEQLKDLLIYILECIEGEPASTYFAGVDDPEAKSATIARLKSCGDDLNAYITSL